MEAAGWGDGVACWTSVLAGRGCPRLEAYLRYLECSDRYQNLIGCRELNELHACFSRLVLSPQTAEILSVKVAWPSSSFNMGSYGNAAAARSRFRYISTPPWGLPWRWFLEERMTFKMQQSELKSEVRERNDSLFTFGKVLTASWVCQGHSRGIAHHNSCPPRWPTI